MDCGAAYHFAGASRNLLICVQSSPSDYKWLFAPLLGLFGAALGIAVAGRLAWLNIQNARDLARRKATLDLIEKFESTEHYRKLTDAFTAVRKADSFDLLVAPGDDTPEKQIRGQVIDYLNHYELVAIGIRDSVLDADIYRLWMRHAFVRDWKKASGWIQAVRWSDTDDKGAPRYNPSAYENYELAAARWSDEPLRLTAAAPPPLVHRDAPPTPPPPPVLPPPILPL